MPDAQFELVDAKDGFADSDWFHHCMKRGKPFVVVRSGEASADVLWDYVTLPACCDEALRRHLGRITVEARAIFDRHATPESAICVKPTAIFFDRLPIDGAKRAANELYALIECYLKEAKKAQRETLDAPRGATGSARRDDGPARGPEARPGSMAREAPRRVGYGAF